MSNPHNGRNSAAGQALPNYGIIIVFMAIAIFIAMQLMGNEIANFFNTFAAVVLNPTG